MSPSMRRRRLCLGGVAACAGLALPLSVAQTPVHKTLTLAVSGKAEMYLLPLVVAEQLGYFRDQGLHVRLDDHPDSSRALQAVLAGAADVVCGAYEHTISLQAQGQLFQCLAMIGRAPQVAVGVSTQRLPRYRRVTDLRGLRVGITARASSTHRVVSLMLERAGMRAYDVEFVELPSPVAATSAMRDGDIDAISHFDPVITELEQRMAIKVVADTRTLRGATEVFGGPMPAACIYGPADFVLKRVLECQALADAATRSLKWLQTAGPSDIIKTIPDAYMLGDRALYLAAFKKMRDGIAVDGVLSEEAAHTALRIVTHFDNAIDARRIQLDKTYTNRYALMARQKFGS